MRELKAGLGLVFGTFWGKVDFIIILLLWLLIMFVSPMINIKELPKYGASLLFLYMYFWPLSMGAAQLAQAYKSVLTCGGLYCVPSLTKGMKRFSIITGFIFAFTFSLPCLLLKGLTLQETYICMALSFTLLAAFSISTSFFSPSASNHTLSRLIWLLQMAVYIRLVLALYPGISLLDGWPSLLTAGIFLCVIYCWPYNDKLVRYAHRQLACSSTDINEHPQQAKIQIKPSVEQFFIIRLNRCSLKAKYIWGAMYPCLGTLLSCFKKVLSLAIVFALLSGFLPKLSPIIIMFIVIMILISGTGIYIKLPVQSQMLIAGGRRERFCGTLAAAFGLSVLIGLMFALIAGISRFIAPFVPSLIIKGQSITFIPLSLYLSFIATGIIPLIFGLKLCHERSPYPTDIGVIMISVPAFTLISFLSSMEIDAVVGWVLATIFIFLSWAFLILTARIICYRKDLILQVVEI